jgi:hypothetical protein
MTLAVRDFGLSFDVPGHLVVSAYALAGPGLPRVLHRRRVFFGSWTLESTLLGRHMVAASTSTGAV